MPSRNASTQTAPDASTQVPDKSGALPAAWRRLLSEPRRRTPSGSILGFLLELVNDTPPVARVEVAPVLLEPVPGGRLG
ncbi:MAG TPA: hypothetical protein VJ722_10305, partial [Rhodanobacteraceae bacterium]|nr:hypothetical protein [Rhodanobacteraceae bacterium]